VTGALHPLFWKSRSLPLLSLLDFSLGTLNFWARTKLNREILQWLGSHHTQMLRRLLHRQLKFTTGRTKKCVMCVARNLGHCLVWTYPCSFHRCGQTACPNFLRWF